MDITLNDWRERKKEIRGGHRIAVLPVLVLCAWMAVCALSEKLPRNPAVPDTTQDTVEKREEQLLQCGMFEWDASSIQRIGEAQELSARLGITRWYQEIEFSDLEEEELPAFVGAMTQMGVKVYALVGEREWGTEQDGASLIACMEKVRAYNKQAPEGAQITGVMADVEPYLLEGWEEHREAGMDAYVSGMIKAHEWSSQNELVLIACIPRHYDDQGLSKQLERLIDQGCDEVAVMNYGCGDEAEKIETEASLAARYGKPLHCILEFQEAGKHGLTEEETYRNKGLEAARAVWEQMEESFEGTELIRDYHWTDPIWDMLAEETGEQGL